MPHVAGYFARVGLLLLVGTLGGCKGVITSEQPLLVSQDASFPVPSGSEITGQSLDDRYVWERDERKARILRAGGYYRIAGPEQAVASSDRFLLKQIGDGQFLVQASNGSEWAYGLIEHADMYYVYTFNRDEQNCTNLSAGERDMLHTTIRKDSCYVTNLRDLVRLLRFLRRKYPYPTSAFTVRTLLR